MVSAGWVQRAQGWGGVGWHDPGANGAGTGGVAALGPSREGVPGMVGRWVAEGRSPGVPREAASVLMALQKRRRGAVLQSVADRCQEEGQKWNLLLQVWGAMEGCFGKAGTKSDTGRPAKGTSRAWTDRVGLRARRLGLGGLSPAPLNPLSMSQVRPKARGAQLSQPSGEWNLPGTHPAALLPTLPPNEEVLQRATEAWGTPAGHCWARPHTQISRAPLGLSLPPGQGVPPAPITPFLSQAPVSPFAVSSWAAERCGPAVLALHGTEKPLGGHAWGYGGDGEKGLPPAQGPTGPRPQLSVFMDRQVAQAWSCDAQ